MIAAPGITVNGVKISIEQINSEVQYHPAQSLFDAKYAAMLALVIRELLLQRAVKLGICTSEEAASSADEVISKVLQKEITVPIPTREECETYYNGNRAKYASPPLFDVSHILYLAPLDDKPAREAALEKARNCLGKLAKDSSLFKEIAKSDSACPSGKLGGRLGQIGKGQTVPGFESALFAMREGDMSADPVATEVGYHIIRVDKRVDEKQLPFEAVAERIADYLRQLSWQRAFSQYVQILAGQAEISGFVLKSADSPLVQ
ncbi:MAG: peptidylprolyl isomerase [Alphaproteobacteria bacterium]|nr:MAG: peptidylprolyl isomerase [Alphaproteobacteria bacterium]